MNLKLSQYALLTLALTLLLNSSYTLWGQTSASQPISSSGNEFMVPKKEVNGKLIGQEDVLIQEVTAAATTDPKQVKILRKIFGKQGNRLSKMVCIDADGTRPITAISYSMKPVSKRAGRHLFVWFSKYIADSGVPE